MKALKSNFYLIKVDDKPVYVGYTNRPIKTRFREHLRDKDFGEGEVSVESLGSMSFDFTWDITLINQYAKEVSDRETELIAEYGTATSVWQKGIHGLVGGTVWSDIKHFVMTNNDNPIFRGMDEGEILEYIERETITNQYMTNFVSAIKLPEEQYMKSFVNSIQDPVAVYMSNFVRTMQYPIVIYMKHFVSHIESPSTAYMRHFVSHVQDPVAVYMSNFVNHIESPIVAYMKGFVKRVESPVAVYMGNFVRHMNEKG